MPRGTEAPDDERPITLVKLIDVELTVGADAVALTVWHPVTSKCPFLLYCANCVGESHSVSNCRAFCSAPLRGLSWRDAKSISANKNMNAHRISSARLA